MNKSSVRFNNCIIITTTITFISLLGGLWRCNANLVKDHSTQAVIPCCLPINAGVEYKIFDDVNSATIEESRYVDDLLIATQHGEFFVSNDGDTWQPSTFENVYPYDDGDMGSHSADNNVRFRIQDDRTGSGRRLLENTSDGSKAWRRRKALIRGTCDVVDPIEIVYHPEQREKIYALAKLVGVESNGTLAYYVSEDAGDNFALILPWTEGKLAISRDAPDVMYASGMRGSIVRSSNGGISWDLVSQNDEIRLDLVAQLALSKGLKGGALEEIKSSEYNKCLQLVIDRSDSRRIFAVTYKGILKSTDGGTSWCIMNLGSRTSGVRSIVLDHFKRDRMYAGTMDGLFKTNNGGCSWESVRLPVTRGKHH
jgi:hypothetical protein